MVSIRRLRAVLLLAVVSAMAWAVIGPLLMGLFWFVVGDALKPGELAELAAIFGMFGFAAGTAWAVGIAMLPRKTDGTVSPLVATLAGALGGLLVTAGMLIASGNVSLKVVTMNLAGIVVTGGIGGAVGLLIQRTAARGRLPAPEEPPQEIEA